MQASNRKFLCKPISHALTKAGAALFLLNSAPIAQAQQTDNDQANDKGAAIQRVEVTGSNIRRADKETPSPVQTITADALKKSGYNTVSEVLRDLTANGQGTLSPSFSGAFAAGASGISLRGLTVGATLVLIDGHRMAPFPLSDDGQRAFVDISSIPFDAVERIDILKDGASAVYGSDAIAGVVNVILKKSYKGSSFAAEGGSSQQGGGSTAHVSFSEGVGDLMQDGYNAYLNLEYRHQNPILVSQRAGQAWTQTDWSAQGGNNLTPGALNIFNGGTPILRSPYLFNTNGDGDTTNPANFAFYPGCNFTAMNANQCTYHNSYAQLQPGTQNLNVLASVTKNFGPDWQLNAKASLFDSRAEQVSGSRPYINFAGYSGNTAFGPGLIPTQVGVIPSFTVPAGYPGNPFGGPANIYAPLVDLGAPRNAVDSKSYRLVTELTGSIGAWDIVGSVGFTKVSTEQTYHNAVNWSALYSALNNTATPYLLTGGNSPAMNAAIAPVFSSRATDELDFVEARAARELMQLPGGALTFAGGLSFVHRNLDAEAPSLIAQGIASGNNTYAIGQQNDASAYVEFAAPLLKNLEIDGAGRFDHYDTYGNSSTPKIGFKYTPLEAIAVRGTFSKGFRAPGPAESQTAGQAYVASFINDPLLCPGGSPGTKGNATQYCNFQPILIQTTNPDVRPERSTSKTFGLILEPVKGWQTTIDYYDIDLKDEIVSAASLDGFVPNFVRGAPQPTTIADGNGGTTIGTPAYGPILYATSPYVNANSANTSGWEIETSYLFKLGDLGKLRANLQWTHVLKYEYSVNGQTYELAGTHGPVFVSGDTGNPRNRAQVTLSYDNGGFDATTTFNWVGSYNVLDPSTGYNSTCQASLQNSGSAFAGATAPAGYCDVSAFLSTNLSLSYNVNKQWSVHGSVQNLFNQAPPVDLQTYGGSGGTAYNPSLHQAGAVGRFFNIGAVYNF